MSSLLAEIGLSEQLVLSYIIGIAGAPAVYPYVRSLENIAWAAHPVMPPPAPLLAQGVAQGQVSKSAAYDWGKQEGFDTAQMDALVNIANVGPGASYAFELWRRGLIDKAGFDRALKRLGLEDQWVGPLENLHDVLLSSAELGMLQQQGFISADRANAEGLLQGVTNERQQLRFEASGLPPGIGEALQMLRRNIIGTGEFAQIVREGHTKTKYTGELLQLQHQVLSAATYVRGFLKGHISRDQMHAGGALTGYTAPDLDLWYLTEGRPATAHQIHIGYARGAALPGATDEQDAIAISVKQSDIRPEYTDLIYAGRDTYPSLFQLTRLVEGGTISPDTGATWAHKSGLAAEVVTALHASWSGTGGGSTTDAHVSKAQTQLWNTTHTAYRNHKLTDAEATTALSVADVAAAAIPTVLQIWQAERDLDRKPLSAAQIKKAYGEAVLNPDTGVAWTKDDALAALIALGMSTADATTFLEL